MSRPFMLVALGSGLLGAAGTAAAQPGGARPPSEDAVAFAQRTSDLMLNTVVAALLQEINETTPDNVEEGNLSISLVFDDRNDHMRLVGTLDPLRHNDRPQDSFEARALAFAMEGQPLTSVERVWGRWYYRRSVPLTNFQPQCALCHENFQGLAPTDPVGALMLRVPITRR